MIKRHTISFKNAFAGLSWAVKTQPNFKIHFTLSLLSIIASFLLKITNTEFLIIIFLIFVGLSIETVNTAIEQTTDAIDEKWRDDIKVAKDVAAGAMLFFAIGAFLIACFIFIPRFLLLF